MSIISPVGFSALLLKQWGHTAPSQLPSVLCCPLPSPRTRPPGRWPGWGCAVCVLHRVMGCVLCLIKSTASPCPPPPPPQGGFGLPGSPAKHLGASVPDSPALLCVSLLFNNKHTISFSPLFHNRWHSPAPCPAPCFFHVTYLGFCSLLAQRECPHSLWLHRVPAPGQLELTGCSPPMGIGVGSSSAFANNAAVTNVIGIYLAPLQVYLRMKL